MTKTQLMNIQRPDEVREQFFQDCGGDPCYQLAVTNGETNEVEILPLESPFHLIGRSPDCDIVIKHWEISYRHCYLQVLGGRILCIDLDSRNGVKWNGERRRSGWLVKGRDVHLGRHTIRLVKGSGKPSDGSDGEMSVSGVLKADSGIFPKISLELLSRNSKTPTGRFLALKPGVTLIGRSRVAQVRLKHDSVSLVHCSLIVTQSGVWIVDLLGRNGTLINGRSVQYGRLVKGDIIKVGEFHLQVNSSLMNPVSAEARQMLQARPPLLGESSVFELGSPKTPESGDSLCFESDPAAADIVESSPPGADAEGRTGARWTEIIEALKSGGFGT